MNRDRNGSADLGGAPEEISRKRKKGKKKKRKH
jgi:hypothetical protein